LYGDASFVAAVVIESKDPKRLDRLRLAMFDMAQCSRY
jgi:hypothetical protein